MLYSCISPVNIWIDSTLSFVQKIREKISGSDTKTVNRYMI